MKSRSQLPFGFCLTFYFRDNKEGNLVQVAISLNCLSAFVSLSTSTRGKVTNFNGIMSQLPFGFCLTFYALSS